MLIHLLKKLVTQKKRSLLYIVFKTEMLTNAQILDLPHPLELGKTKDYCPVSFVDSNILTRAVEGNLVAKYDVTIIKISTNFFFCQ